MNRFRSIAPFLATRNTRNRSRQNRPANHQYATLEPRQLLAALPVISEFMATNTSTLNDGYGDSTDWIELTNAGDTPVDLAGYHLTDDAVNPSKWTFTQSTVLQPGDYLIVFASSRDVIDPLGFNHTNFKLSAGGEYIGLSDPSGNLLSEMGSLTSNYPPQVTDVSFGRVGGSLLNGQSVAEYWIPTNGGLGTSWTGNGFDSTGTGFVTDRAGIGYEASPGGTVDFTGLFDSQEIDAGTTSVYVRTEFEVTAADAITDLTLTMMYDDGFAAYMNGTFLFSRNAANGLAWNASASASHSDANAVQAIAFGLDGSAGSEGDFLDLLVDGTNTLAIHALNRPGSSDMLMVPTLLSNAAGSGAGSYLASPTPGAPNTAPVTLGPAIDDVTSSGITATAGQPLTITASISEFDRPVDPSSARLHYRVMYGGETTVSMNDAGLGDDAVSGDGIYTATIPGAALLAGEMVRWYVTAEDIDDNLTRAPRFIDALNSPEYFGTVVADPSISTDLPLLQWFVQDTAGASTNEGARGSLFYNDTFYDNIQTDAHGGSTRGADFPKKSFDFDATSGNKFEIIDGYKASDFNLLTNYGDQTKLRNTLHYQAMADAGIASHLAFSVTVYRNGSFYGLYDLVEEGDEEYLERNGLDPNGALYKVQNKLTHAYTNVEKKSREYEDHSDFQEVVDAATLNGSAATTWDLDNLDIADVINYLAAQNVDAGTDFGHKNFYWYHDNDGTGQWSVFLWDADLSYGHKWNGNLPDRYFDNALVTTGSATFGTNNPIFTRIYNDPTLRAMYFRRLRTLMDQLYGPPGTPAASSPLAQRIDALEVKIADEAILDRAKWGLNSQFAAAYPFDVDDAIDQLRDAFIDERRNFLASRSDTPSSQPLNPTITFDDNDYDASPVSGLQSEEYVRLRNNNGTAIDISGWELTGGIEHTFKGGTVIPANGSLYVVADVISFKNRSTGASGGQQKLIQGNYQGQLSSDGEVVSLVSTSGTTIDTLTTPNEGPSDNQQFLRITEFNYNPIDAAGNAEYIEFMNVSSGANATSLDLSGVTISEGPSTPFVFTNGISLLPGTRLLVVKDAAAFSAAYPSANPFLIAGTYSGSLSNSGETIRVDDFGGERILEFTYGDSDPWSPVADGAGGSLQLIDEVATPVDLLDKYYSWRGSYREGTPLAPAYPANANVVISEVLAHTDSPQVDFIELHNPSSSSIDVGGWYLSDAKSSLQKYQIPASTVIVAGGYVVFDENDFNPTPLTPGPNDFALSSEGDQVWLTSSLGGETTFIDVVDFGATFNGESVGPVPVAAGRLSPLATPTPAAANSAERVGPLLITEVHYHPVDPSTVELSVDSTLTASDFEFVEIHNPTSVAVSLQDWQLRGGVDYDFDSFSIAAGATLLVVPFNPSSPDNGTLVSLFRNRHGISSGVTLMGGYAGSLSNSFARVELQRPDAPDPLDPTIIPHVTSDEVLYDDLSPWPNADGNGQSLQRIAGNVSGNLVANWLAASPTPGAVSLTVVAPQVASLVRDGGSMTRPDQLETISITFDSGVNVSAGDFSLRNETTGGSAVNTSGIVFNYDSVSRTATWDLGDLPPMAPAYYTVVVSDDVAATGSGLKLDGDASGSAGGDFEQLVYVALPGDANLDGQVDVLGDAAVLVENLGSSGFGSWATGDFNADGQITVLGDASVLVDRLGQSVVIPVATASSAITANDSGDAQHRDIAFASEFVWNDSDEKRKRQWATNQLVDSNQIDLSLTGFDEVFQSSNDLEQSII